MIAFIILIIFVVVACLWATAPEKPKVERKKFNPYVRKETIGEKINSLKMTLIDSYQLFNYSAFYEFSFLGTTAWFLLHVGVFTSITLFFPEPTANMLLFFIMPISLICSGVSAYNRAN